MLTCIFSGLEIYNKKCIVFSIHHTSHQSVGWPQAEFSIENWTHILQINALQNATNPKTNIYKQKQLKKYILTVFKNLCVTSLANSRIAPRTPLNNIETARKKNTNKQPYLNHKKQYNIRMFFFHLSARWENEQMNDQNKTRKKK